MRVGILSAMREELDGLVAEMGTDTQVREAGMRTYHLGELWGQPAALAFSRWGKVAAATTATYLITHCGVDRVIFTGVAGGADPLLRIGDIVIGTRLYQHDMDSRPLFARHEIPLLGVTAFETDTALRQALLSSAQRFVGEQIPQQLHADTLAEFHIHEPTVTEGEIASGDRFFAARAELAELRGRLPRASCVEMEGAAVAQVCHEYGVPFAIVRTISDSADEHAPISFAKFIREIASVYSHGILRNYLCDADVKR